ncbi:MAG: hypothetical protein OEW30_12945, partial [Acidimicrobiia bacterium]|nr:hypothetical protein [Acidimicrobiia bacterium]
AFIEDLKSQADRSIRTRLLLEGVARKAGLEVEREEIAAVVESVALQSEKPDDVRRALADPHREKSLSGDILRNKALEAILTGASPVDDDGNPVELTVDSQPEDADREEVEVPAGVPVSESAGVAGLEFVGEVVEADVIEEGSVEPAFGSIDDTEEE